MIRPRGRDEREKVFLQETDRGIIPKLAVCEHQVPSGEGIERSFRF
jgi:hypothetical protein